MNYYVFVLQLATELKMIAEEFLEKEVPFKYPERIIKNGLLVTEGGGDPEVMQVEDLAALERLTEDNLIRELEIKYRKGNFMSFIGDVLLILNPNTHEDIYNDEVSGVIVFLWNFLLRL